GAGAPVSLAPERGPRRHDAGAAPAVTGSGARARERPAGALTPGRPPAGPAPPRPYAHGSTCSGYSVGSTREARARLTSGQARSSERGQRPNSSWRTHTRPPVAARSGRPHPGTNRHSAKLRRPHRPKGRSELSQVRLGMVQPMMGDARTDATRNVTFMFANDVSPRSFSFLEGVSENHHSSSHHGRQQRK